MSKMRENRGQSLVEVIVAILFLAMILLMSLNFMTAGIRGNSRGREMSVATYLAHQILAEMKLCEFEDLPDFDGFTTGGGLPATEPARSICMDWEEAIQDELPSGLGEVDVVVGASRVSITVVVEWVDGVNKERRVRYETLISDSV